MGSQYAGSDFFPVNYTVPDDGDGINASAFNVAFEALGDRTIWLKNKLPYLSTVTVTASGTVTVPAGATHCFVEGCGGGGGGGIGDNSPGALQQGCGGAGGGGAQLVTRVLEVTSGESLTVTIGAGGTGSVASSVAGGNGGDTLIQRSSTTIYTARGAQGGGTGGNIYVGTSVSGYDWYIIAVPGSPVRGTYPPGYVIGFAASLGVTVHGAGGEGGGDLSPNISGVRISGFGVASPQGFGGGAPGINGIASGSYRGGGGGAGGGGGPFGVGGAGGNAGSGASGVATNGVAGVSASPNTGAGGGGGGAAGGGGTAGAVGGAGGNGGSGYLRLTFLRVL